MPYSKQRNWPPLSTRQPPPLEPWRTEPPHENRHKSAEAGRRVRMRLERGESFQDAKRTVLRELWPGEFKGNPDGSGS